MFHFCTLEEFYVGGMFLGVGNCITDLALPLIGLLFYCGAEGTGFMQNEVTEKWLFSDVLFAVTFVIQAVQILLCFHGMIKNQDPVLGEPVHAFPLLGQVASYLTMLSITSALLFVGEHPMIMDSESNGLFLVCLLQCLLMQHMTCHIQISHCTKQRYSALDNRLYVFIMTMCMMVMFFNSHISMTKSVAVLLLITVGS